MTKKYLIVLATILLLLISIVILFQFKKPSTPSKQLPTDGDASDWTGDQDLPNKHDDIPMIAIPGIDSLVFTAGTTTQNVNFHNPEENVDILFKESLFVDDICYWESGYIESGKGYYSIELTKPIDRGEYTAYLNVQCFRPDGTKLNGAKVEFTLTVQ